MNPSSREGWPPQPPPGSMNMPRLGEQPQRPPGQPQVFGPLAPSQQQGPSSGPVLPPPTGWLPLIFNEPPPLLRGRTIILRSFSADLSQGPYHPGSNPPAPNLPTIAGMTQQTPTALPPQRPVPHEHPGPPPQMQQVQYAPQSYTLPTLNQPGPPPPVQTQQPHGREREMQEAREREAQDREMEQKRREHQREREAREQQVREQQQTTPHQNHAENVQLHQPVAVGPQVRSAIHGPNGLLSSGGGQQPAPASTPSSGPNGAVSLFTPQFDRTPQSGAQPTPLPAQNMNLNAVTLGLQHMAVPGVAPGQQPILNDALSYLDQVKVQFVGDPHVYNQFLDIMKDFKSQAIDTPGVIRRVSALFQGNPNLIQGFNTFLPPGYRIECGTADDPNEIRVTTPQGTTVSPMGRPIDPPPEHTSPIEASASASAQTDAHLFDRDSAAGWSQQRSSDQMDAYLSPSNRPQAGLPLSQSLAESGGRMSPSDSTTVAGHSSRGVNAALLAHQQEERGVSQLQNAVAAQGDGQGRALAMSPMPEASNPTAGTAESQQGGLTDRRGPVEFNHAISYVNKIKNRFSSQPEIYKQFLEILQTYQRESKPIQDVYAQVTHLFNGAPDLLDDFKQFLPESAAHAKAAAARREAEDATTLSNVRSDYGGQNHSQYTPRAEQHRMPPVGNFGTTPSTARDSKRKRGDRAGTAATGPMNTASTNVEYAGSSRGGFVPNKRGKQSHGQSQKYQTQPDAPHVSPTLAPALPEPMPPNASMAATQDELNFFDRVKKYINNRQYMSDFLKLCNLYSQDVIDKNTLVFRSSNYIGNNQELFNWFKDFLAYDGRDQVIENRPREVTGRVNLNNCRSLGQSYREMPKRERMKSCSGRDETCNAVLNDRWVSHPTWASEDSGFIAHKKNTHEEGLHRIEEERHDYDIYTAINARVIQFLEPFAQQVHVMTPEQRSNFRLHAAKEGNVTAILKKCLTKIYGRENAQPVIDDLEEAPANVIPVVLSRCRQIGEHWKQCQREWEKIWREQTQKMFWKSLDHQGINIKMGDKRQFQMKTLQNEVQAKFEEQKRQRLLGNAKVPRFQLETVFVDHDVLMDASRLLLIYAESSHATELPKLLPFIKELIPLFFGFPLDQFQKRIEEEFSASAQEQETENETQTTTPEPSSHRGRHMNGKRADLLRGVLDKGSRTRSTRRDAEDSLDPSSRASTPDARADADEEMQDPDSSSTSDESIPETWVFHPSDGNTRRRREIRPNEPFERHIYNLYANLPIYCFFRVFCTLYERLFNLKQSEPQTRDTVRRAKGLKPANELRMTDKGPDNYFYDTGPDANYYSQMLVMLEQFIRGEGGVDMLYIEDVLRRYYLTNGWMLYSFDKLMSALVRFGLGLLGNESNKDKSADILGLFFKDRRKETTTHLDEMAYRRQVEKYVKEGDVYRIAYNLNTSKACIGLLKKDDPTFTSRAEDGLLTPDQRWACYVTAYTSVDTTEGVPQDQVPLPFLRRTLHAATKAAETDAAFKTAAAAAADGNTEREVEDQGAAADPKATGLPDAKSARWNSLHHGERLMLKISPDDYRIYWPVPGTGLEEEWWAVDRSRAGGDSSASSTGKKLPDNDDEANGGKNGKGKQRVATSVGDDDGGVETMEKEEEEEEEEGDEEDGGSYEPDEEAWHAFDEKFVMNSAWMRGWSRDEVAARNREFRGWVGEVEEEGGGE